MNSPTAYKRLGGIDAMRCLVHRFYEPMDELLEAWDVLPPAPREPDRQ